jgi:hypothetical protein
MIVHVSVPVANKLEAEPGSSSNGSSRYDPDTREAVGISKHLKSVDASKSTVFSFLFLTSFVGVALYMFYFGGTGKSYSRYVQRMVAFLLLYIFFYLETGRVILICHRYTNLTRIHEYGIQSLAQSHQCPKHTTVVGFARD